MNLKSFHIETFGCQMNKGDSEIMESSMSGNGFYKAQDEPSADIVIFNTCSVREHAEARALARIKAAKSASIKKGGMVVVTGCMAQRLGERLLRDKSADLVIGTYQSPAIGQIVLKFLDTGRERAFLSFDPADLQGRLGSDTPAGRVIQPWHKWVTITHGCGNFCSYCIVPFVRGPLVSFPSESIIRHIERCVQNGAKEISLLGQNVNQYGMDSGDIPFYKLLEKAAAVRGLYRINFLTSHPKDFSDDIIRVIRDNENVSRAVHLPLQSGSDRILEAMNRRYALDHYMKITEQIEKVLGNFSLSTDLIVGFPGETPDDFSATLDAVKRIRFDEAFMYAYSPRSGTAACSLKESLTRGEKLERLQELIRVQRAISLEKLEQRVNRTEDVIVEGPSKKSSDEMMGKTFLNHPVVFKGLAEDIGKKARIRITGTKGSTLYGEKIA